MRNFMSNSLKTNKRIEIFNRAMEALAAEELLGICIACGEEYDGPLEPDARNVECQVCGEPEVFGAEEIILKWGW